MAEVLRVDPLNPDQDSIARAADCVRRGGLVAFPTETVYGLGADATSREAVLRIFAAKGRPSTDPLIVHVADVHAARAVVASLPDIAVILANAFWPGPLTLVLPRSPLIGDEVTAGLTTVGVRVPAHPVARALVRAAGVPIAAPSANLFSRPSPTRAEHVIVDLGDRIDMVLDAGPTQVGVESTVLDLTSHPPSVLRPGGISIEQLRAHLPDIQIRAASQGSAADAMASPGMLSRHYAPQKPLVLLEGDPGAVAARLCSELSNGIRRREVLLGSREALAFVQRALAGHPEHARRVTIVDLGSESDLSAIAARLYAALRECDATSADRIIALQLPDTGGLAVAIRDRLRRASSGNIVTVVPSPPAPSQA